MVELPVFSSKFSYILLEVKILFLNNVKDKLFMFLCYLSTDYDHIEGEERNECLVIASFKELFKSNQLR